MGVDWRADLHDAVDSIVQQLQAIDIAASVELGDEELQGWIEIDGKRENIKYVPNDDDDFDKVIQSINGLIKGKAQYRKFRSSEGSDGWWYGLLTDQAWTSLDTTTPEVTNLLFLTMPERGSRWFKFW